MAFRLGLNTGDIHEQDDGTVYGDGVNVAARLEGLAPPGGICVSGKFHDEVHGKLDLAFADMGEHEVKNIADPVRVFRVDGIGRPVTAKRRIGLRVAAFGVAVTVAVAGIAIWQPWPDGAEVATVPAMPDGPSIAVLPFDNLTGDAEQDYFSDGITEDIISALSRFRSLFVIGKDSTIR